MKEYRVTFTVRFHGNLDNDTAGLCILNALRRGAPTLDNYSAERSEVDIKEVVQAPPQATTDLNALVEDSWTCQCTACGIKSFHDSDVGKPCIKAPLCSGTMEGRVHA